MNLYIRVIALLLVAVLAITCFGYSAQAEDSVSGFRETELPLPRFVSLRSEQVYVRAGPAFRYPIKWVYKRDAMPVEIIQEFDSWRKIRDFEGDEGWVHTSLLVSGRTGLIKGNEIIPLREGFSNDSKMVARLEPMVVAGISKCTDGWCKVQAGSYRGWVERNFIWGIYADEELN